MPMAKASAGVMPPALVINRSAAPIQASRSACGIRPQTFSVTGSGQALLQCR